MSDDVSRKVVLAVGGSGGHLFPAQGLAQMLKHRLPHLHLSFMGAGLSRSRYFVLREYPYSDIPSAPLSGGISRLASSILRLTQGVIQSCQYLSREKPDLVVGFGSFHAFPVMIAAVLCRIPLVLFEANVVPGKVNRLLSRWAKVSATQFREAKQRLQGHVVETARPLWDKDHLAELTKADAARYFSLSVELPTILVFGGSQGARALNQHFCQAMHGWDKRPLVQVIHLTGDLSNCHEALLCYRRLAIPAAVKVFEERMPFAWKLADLAVCRAGGGTIAELLAFHVPAILIPYPYAGAHQVKNAHIFAHRIGGGVVIQEHELDAQLLSSHLEALFQSDRRRLAQLRTAMGVAHAEGQGSTLCQLIETVLEEICHSDPTTSSQ